MIDLHTHTLFSDGVLLPSELVYRAKVQGYEAIALTDHGDFSTFDFAIPRLVKVARDLSHHYGITVIPGVEITYVPPPLIKKAVAFCRRKGARIVVVHGETPAETVPPGTNRSAILSGADILAHPGPITDEEVKLARQRNIHLEITTRPGHNRTNSHVAALAKRYGAPLVLNTDTHTPDNLLTTSLCRQTLRAAGLGKEDADRMYQSSRSLVAKICKR